ncbi:hypothetical protein WJX84_010307 [Apatococcus fuscideae]|uniref:Uncharacterized protein n=1 Tax=Apatococcus fuscideae TaxID=2026836 RepID=A0AAW1T0R0_9CHLO
MKNRRDEVRDSGSRWPFSVCFNRDLLYCEGFCRKAVAGQLEHDNLAHITGAIRTGSFSKDLEAVRGPFAASLKQCLTNGKKTG